MNDLFNSNIPTINDRDRVARGDSNVTIFENVTFGKIRTILKDGEPLFCLSDIAKILDFRDGLNLKNSILKEFELSILDMYSFDTGFGIKEFSM